MHRLAGTAKPLRARAHLLVTVPLYMDWDSKRSGDEVADLPRRNRGSGRALAGSAPLSGQRAAPPLTGGNGTLYIGGYPNVIWIIDEATEKVVGTIQTKSGIPRRLTLSRDQKRFYNIDATNEFVEVLDIASKTTVDSFRLTEGNKRVRIASLEPDPQNKYLMMITRTATRARDHVEIGPSELQQFDLASHKVVKTVPWPDGQERDQANLLFSPDGKLLYFLGDEILIFETQNFTQVDKWDLSNFEEGLGQVSVSFGGFGGLDTTNDEPGFLTTTLTVGTRCSIAGWWASRESTS